MKATTFKVEGELLKELERTKPPQETLSGYVRSILEREVRRRRLAEAADRYVQLLRDAPDERAWLDEWVRPTWPARRFGEGSEVQNPPARAGRAGGQRRNRAPRRGSRALPGGIALTAEC